MALLFQLLRALNENELNIISVMPMQDREREVFNMVRKVHQKTFPSLSISKQLNLQTGHLDKINSVLLKKSMEVLAGPDIYDQINYLASKTGQWNLAKHLLKSYELKILSVSGNSADKKKFYKFCFEWIVTAPFSHQDEKEVDYYATSFLENTDVSEKPEQKLHIETVLLRRKINMAISKTTIHNQIVAEEIHQELYSILREAEHLASPVQIFKIKSLAIVYHNFMYQFDSSLQLANDLNKLVSNNSALFSGLDSWMAGWYQAQIYFHSSRFEEAFLIYLKLAGEVSPGNRSKWFMFFAEYLQVCLITGRMDHAENIINQYFKNYVDDVNGTIFISAALQTAKFYLYGNQFIEAKKLLDLIKKNLQKTSMLQFQFAVKELFAAHAYLTGDYKKAMQLAEQNLKFMRFKNIHRTMPDFTYHSRLIKPIHKFKTAGQELNAKENLMLQELQKGTRAQYGKLLLRWIEKETEREDFLPV